MKIYIKEAREKAGLSQKELALKVGVAPSTFHGYESGNHDPKSELLKKIAQVCGVSIDFLLGHTTFENGSKKAPSISDGAMKLAKNYDTLDRWGKQALRELAETELARMEDDARFLEEAREPEEAKVIPLYLTPAAAGYASPALESDFTPMVLGPDDPKGADFAVRLQGDSMEPDFPDGSVVFCNHDPMKSGDIGVFVVDGEAVCKQYHRDPAGIVYLFSLNRKRADADIVLPSSSGRTLTCMGRVITKRRHPLPGM